MKSEPIMVDVRALLERCDKEEGNPDPVQRLLYTSEIRRLLGFGFPPDYSKLAAALAAELNDGQTGEDDGDDHQDASIAEMVAYDELTRRLGSL